MKNFIRKLVRDAPIRHAWRRLIHLWKPMAGWTLLVWAAMAVIIAPLSSGLLSSRVFLGGDLVIGNEELLAWLISPAGTGYLLLGASLALAGWGIRFIGIFQIVTDDLHGRTVNLRNTALRILRRLPSLFQLCISIVAAGLFLLLLLATGIALIYQLFLGTYDINYYLSAAPAEWHFALIMAAAWFLIWLTGAIYLSARCLPALPDYLNSPKSVAESIRYAWNIDHGKSRNNLLVILLSIGFWLLMLFIADTIFISASAAFINWIGGYVTSVRIIALATGLYIAGSFLLDALISFLGFSYVSTLTTKLYYEDVETATAAPPPSRYEFRNLASFLKKMVHPKRLLPVAGLAVLASVLLSGYMLDRISPSKGNTAVKIAAHRAGPPPAPENSLEALERSIQTGAEYAEIDVRLTGDSVVVVAHDADLMRTADHPARISDTGIDSLRKLSGMTHYKDETRWNGISTLEKFLESARGRIQLMIELKESSRTLAQRTVDAVRQKEMEDRAVIISLNLEAVRRVREIAPDIKTGYISAFTVGDVSRLPVSLLAVTRQSATGQLIDEAQQRGMEVYVWTVNRAARMANMIEREVDGIITDDPELAIRVRSEMQELTLAERLLLQFQYFVVEDIN